MIVIAPKAEKEKVAPAQPKKTPTKKTAKK